jgi:hypothetical protein
VVSSQSDDNYPNGSFPLETDKLIYGPRPNGTGVYKYTNIFYLHDFLELDAINTVMEKLKILLIANRGEIAVRITKTAK